MLKKIKSTDLRLGMYVHKVHSSWLKSPLVMSEFTVSTQKDIDRILDYDIKYVSINLDKGVDIARPEDDAPEEKREDDHTTELRLEDTFTVELSEFWTDRDMPVDLYTFDNSTPYHIMKQGLHFSHEVKELLQDRQIISVHVPESQQEQFLAYRREIEEKTRKQEEQGYSGEYVDPSRIEQRYNLQDNFHSVSVRAFIPGTTLKFDVFTVESDIPHISLKSGDRVEVDLVGSWLEAGSELVIRNADKPAYQEYIILNARDSEDEAVRATFIFENSKILVEDLAENPRSGHLMDETRISVKEITNQLIENPTTFYSLTKLNTYDYYTFTHSVNVSTLSLALALSAGLDDEEELSDLGLGAILHDLGKSQVSSKLINKPGKLTSEEFVKVKDHVNLGYEMIRDNPAVPERATYPLLQHHEKLSGNGYPNKLQADQIHILGRITGIIDVYDALTTERPYKKAMKPFDALSIIFKGEDDFDKGLLKHFVEMLHQQQI